MSTTGSETHILLSSHRKIIATRQRHVLLILTVACFINSFIFSILSITSSSWATVANYSGPNSAARTFIGRSTRGPFKYCLLVPKDGISNTSTNPADFYQDCSAPKCTTAGPNYDYEFFCQQLHISGNLLISGTTFIGLAMLMTFPVMASSVASKKPHKPDLHWDNLPVPTAVYSLIVVFGVVLMAVANLIGAQVLVNEQRDDADFISSMGGIQTVTDHWMIGKGVWFALAGWSVGLIAVVLLNEAGRVRVDNVKEKIAVGDVHARNGE